MSEIISSSGLGLFNSSLSLLGQSFGQSSIGQANENSYINIVNGNLILQNKHEGLANVGIDSNLIKTYNSQGTFSGESSSNWLLGVARLTSIVPERSITRQGADGHRTVFTFNELNQRYESTSGAGAHDYIKENDDGSYTWYLDGDNSVKERYESGLLTIKSDRNNNQILYKYDRERLTEIRSNSGSIELLYESELLASMLVNSEDLTSNRYSYKYDEYKRLIEVKIDLTPDDQSIADNNYYSVNYSYDGTSQRISELKQSDGTFLRYEYEGYSDGSFKVSQVIDGLGNITKYRYQQSDSHGQYTEVINALGHSSKYYFEPESGLLVRYESPVVDGQRLTTSYKYDGDGNLIKLIDGSGAETLYEYDSAGNRIAEKDSLGNLISRTYSSLNQLLTESAHLDGQIATQRWVYDEVGNLAFKVNAEGEVDYFKYQDSQLAAHWSYSEQKYDISSLSYDQPLVLESLSVWLSSVDRSAAKLIEYSYDFRGLLNHSKTYDKLDSSGFGISPANKTSYVYDYQGRLISTISASGNAGSSPELYQTSFAYDGLGRQVSSTNSLAQSSITQYLDQESKIIQISANQLITTMSFNANGQLTSSESRDEVSLVDSSSIKYFYDKAQRQIAIKRQDGAIEYFYYDSNNRLQATVDGSGSVAKYSYDTRGLLTETLHYATEVNTQDWYVDDEIVRPEFLTIVPSPSADDRLVSQFYDSAGRLTETKDAEGSITRYQYDRAGNLIASMKGDRRTRLFYDRAFRQVASLDAAGFLTEQHYDKSGQLIATTAYITQVELSISDSATLDELRPISSDNDQLERFYYNDRGLLIGTLNAEQYLIENRYDESGNLVERIEYSQASTVVTDSSSIDEVRPSTTSQDRYTRFSYDSLGQLIAKKNYQGTVSQYGYDSAGNLIFEQINSATDTRRMYSAYDAKGNISHQLNGQGSYELGEDASKEQIIEQTEYYGTQYFYNSAGQVISEMDALGNKHYYYYNRDGLQEYSVKADGSVSHNSYNAFNELVANTIYAEKISTSGLTGGFDSSELVSRLNLVVDPARDQTSQFKLNRRGQIKNIMRQILNDGVLEHYETTNQYNYYSELKQTSVQNDLAGQVSTIDYSYNKQGLVVASLTNSAASAGQQISSTNFYDGFGRLVKTLDGLNQETHFKYDKLGQVIQVENALGQTTLTRYDAFKQTLSTTDPLGNITRFYYDNVERKVVVESASGVLTSSYYNEHGELVESINGEGESAHYRYDKNGQQIEFEDYSGEESNSKYDQVGNLISTINSKGVEISYEYDKKNQLIRQIVDPTGLQLITEYKYDGLGNQVEITDPRGVISRSIFNSLGQLIETINDVGGLNIRTGYEYDGQNNQVKISSALGTDQQRTTRYEYDLNNRLINTIIVTEDANYITQYRYDKANNLVQTEDPNGIITEFEYDSTNRQVSKRYDLFGQNLLSRQAYYADGNLKSETDENGIVTFYEYSADKNLISKTLDYGGLNLTEQYLYDANNQLVLKIDPNGTQTKIFRDEMSRVIQEIKDYSGLNISTRYQYDELGNVRFITHANNSYQELLYDNANRKIAQIDDAFGERIATEYKYDEVGNLLQLIDPNKNTTHYQYDQLNRLTKTINSDAGITVISQSTYNQHDEMVEAIDPNGNSYRYFYDSRGNLKYQIDPSGFTTEFIHDPAANLIETKQYEKAIEQELIKQLYSVSDVTVALSASWFNDFNDGNNSGFTERNYADSIRNEDGEVIFDRSLSSSANTPILYTKTRPYEQDKGYRIDLKTDDSLFNEHFTWVLNGSNSWLDRNRVGVYVANGAIYSYEKIAGEEATQTNLLTSLEADTEYTIDLRTNADQVIIYLREKGKDISSGIIHQVATPDEWGMVNSLLYTNVGAIDGSEVRVDNYLEYDLNPSAARSLYSIKDSRGLERFSVDVDGSVVEYQYDNVGGLLAKIAYQQKIPAGYSDWNEADLAALIASFDSRVERFVNDSLGRQIYAIDAAGFVTKNTYDLDGAIVNITSFEKAISTNIMPLTESEVEGLLAISSAVNEDFMDLTSSAFDLSIASTTAPDSAIYHQTGSVTFTNIAQTTSSPEQHSLSRLTGFELKNNITTEFILNASNIENTITDFYAELSNQPSSSGVSYRHGVSILSSGPRGLGEATSNPILFIYDDEAQLSTTIGHLNQFLEIEEGVDYKVEIETTAYSSTIYVYRSDAINGREDGISHTVDINGLEVGEVAFSATTKTDEAISLVTNGGSVQLKSYSESQQEPANRSENYIYNSAGWQQYRIDAENFVTEYFYDSMQNIIETRQYQNAINGPVSGLTASELESLLETSHLIATDFSVLDSLNFDFSALSASIPLIEHDSSTEALLFESLLSSEPELFNQATTISRNDSFELATNSNIKFSLSGQNIDKSIRFFAGLSGLSSDYQHGVYIDQQIDPSRTGTLLIPKIRLLTHQFNDPSFPSENDPIVMTLQEGISYIVEIETDKLGSTLYLYEQGTSRDDGFIHRQNISSQIAGDVAFNAGVVAIEQSGLLTTAEHGTIALDDFSETRVESSYISNKSFYNKLNQQQFSVDGEGYVSQQHRDSNGNLVQAQRYQTSLLANDHSLVKVLLKGTESRGYSHYKVYADGEVIGSGYVDWAEQGDTSAYRELSFSSEFKPQQVWVEFDNDGGASGLRELAIDWIEVNGQRFETDTAVYRLADGSLSAGSDYLPVNGRLEFNTEAAPDKTISDLYQEQLLSTKDLEQLVLKQPSISEFYIYDSLNRNTFKVDGENIVTQYYYDAADNLIQEKVYDKKVVAEKYWTEYDLQKAIKSTLIEDFSSASLSLNTNASDSQGFIHIDGQVQLDRGYDSSASNRYPILYGDHKVASTGQGYKVEISTSEISSNEYFWLRLDGNQPDYSERPRVGFLFQNGQVFFYQHHSDDTASTSLILDQIGDDTRYIADFQFTESDKLSVSLYQAGAPSTELYRYDFIDNGWQSARMEAFTRVSTSEVEGSPIAVDNWLEYDLNDPEPDFITQRYIYDERNLTTFKIDGNGYITQTEYDDFGNLISEIKHAEFTYQQISDLTLFTDQTIQQRYQELISFNLIDKNSDQLVTSKYVYNNKNLLTFEVDAAGYVTEFLYNAYGEVIQQKRYSQAVNINQIVTEDDVKNALQAELGIDFSSSISGFHHHMESHPESLKVTQQSLEFARVYNDSNATVSFYQSYQTYQSSKIYRMEVSTTDLNNEKLFINLNNNGSGTAHKRHGLLFNSGVIQAYTRKDGLAKYQLLNQAKEDTTYVVEFELLDDKTVLYLYEKGQTRAQGLEQEFVTEPWNTVRFWAYTTTGPSEEGSSIFLDNYSEINTEIAANSVSDFYQYDDRGLVTSTTDALGEVEQYRYDAFANRNLLINKNGDIWSYQYDKRNLLINERSPRVNNYIFAEGQTQPEAVLEHINKGFEYDAQGNVTTIVEGVGSGQERVISYGYDSNGNQTEIQRIKDGELFTNRTSFDSFNRALVNQDEVGSFNYKVANAAGSLQFEIDSLGFVTEHKYNGFAQQISTTRYANAIDLSSRDSVKPFTEQEVRTLLLLDPAQDRTMEVEYDAKGQKIRIVQSAQSYFTASEVGGVDYNTSPEVRYSYDAYGNVIEEAVKVNASEWARSHHYYDEKQQLIATVDGQRYLKTYAYDSQSNLIETIEYARQLSSDLDFSQLPAAPEVGNQIIGFDRVTNFAYDAMNRQIQVSKSYDDGIMRTINQSSYDKLGNLLTSSDVQGNITEHSYDKLGRTIKMLAPERQVAAAYSQNFTALAVRPSSEYYLDVHGNAIQIVQSSGHASIAASRKVNNQYDEFGNLIKTIDANGHFNEYDYDGLGRITEERNQLTHHINGNLQSNDNIKTTRYSYDAVGQQINTAVESSVHGQEKIVNHGAVFNAFGEHVSATLNIEGEADLYVRGSYSYNLNGQRVSAVESGVEKLFSYDLTGQVTKLVEAGLKTTINSYDLKGNLIRQQLPIFTGSADATTMKRPVVEQTVDAFNNVLSISQSKERKMPDGSYQEYMAQTSFQYNQDNKVVLKVEPQVSYMDELGQRHHNFSPTTQLTYNLLGQETSMTDAKGHVMRKQYNSVGDLIASIDANGNRTEFLYNGFSEQALQKNALGIVTYQKHDNKGQVSEQGIFQRNLNSDGNPVGAYQKIALAEYQYNEAGLRTQTTKHYSQPGTYMNQVSYSTENSFYDHNGNLIKTDPGYYSGVKSYQYDAAGNKSLEEDSNVGSSFELANGASVQALTWNYDLATGRLQSKTNLEGRIYNYTYNLQGLVESEVIVNQNSEIDNNNSYSYYQNGLLQNIHQFSVSLGGVTNNDNSTLSENLAIEYDISGNRVKESHSSQRTRSYQYTFYNQVDWLAGGHFQTITYNYSTETSRVFDFEYDSLDRLSSVTSASAEQNILRNGVGSHYQTTELNQLKYDYDQVGNRRHLYYSIDKRNSNELETKDIYYAYDANNNMTISQGILSSLGVTIDNNQGIRLTYDALDRRATSYSIDKKDQQHIVNGSYPTYEPTIYNYDQYKREIYNYNDFNQLETIHSAIDKVNYQYVSGPTDATSPVEQLGDYLLTSERDNDYQGRVMLQKQYSELGEHQNTTASLYNNDGSLRRQTTLKANGNYESIIDFSYASGGVLRHYTVQSYGDSNNYLGSYQLAKSYHGFENYSEAQATIAALDGLPNYAPGTTLTEYNGRGQKIKVKGTGGEEFEREFIYSLEGNILFRMDKLLPANSNSLTYEGQDYFYQNSKQLGSAGEVSSTDFDYNFQAISSSYPAATPSSYLVNQGDTLRQIAQAVYGDAALWSVIADRNSVSAGPGESLDAGQRLSIPNVVNNQHNNAETFKPFDPSQIYGDTSPALEFVPPPTPKNCSILATILIAVVVVIVSVYTAGAGAAAFSAIGTGATAAGATVGGAGISILSGAAAASSLGLAGTAAIAGVAGAVGAMAGQVAGMALGVQDKFNWGAVAIGGLTSAASAGIGSLFGEAANTVKQGFSAAAAAKAAGQAAVGSFVNYGIQELVNKEKQSFNWASLGVSTVSAGAMAGFKDSKTVKFLQKSNSSAVQVLKDSAVGFTKAATVQLLREGKIDSVEIAADAFGNALATSLKQSIIKNEGLVAERKKRLETLKQRPQQDKITGISKGPIFPEQKIEADTNINIDLQGEALKSWMESSYKYFGSHFQFTRFKEFNGSQHLEEGQTLTFNSDKKANWKEHDKASRSYWPEWHIEPPVEPPKVTEITPVLEEKESSTVNDIMVKFGAHLDKEVLLSELLNFDNRDPRFVWGRINNTENIQKSKLLNSKLLRKSFYKNESGDGTIYQYDIKIRTYDKTRDMQSIIANDVSFGSYKLGPDFYYEQTLSVRLTGPLLDEAAYLLQQNDEPEYYGNYFDPEKSNVLPRPRYELREMYKGKNWDKEDALNTEHHVVRQQLLGSLGYLKNKFNKDFGLWAQLHPDSEAWGILNSMSGVGARGKTANPTVVTKASNSQPTRFTNYLDRYGVGRKAPSYAYFNRVRNKPTSNTVAPKSKGSSDVVAPPKTQDVKKNNIFDKEINPRIKLDIFNQPNTNLKPVPQFRPPQTKVEFIPAQPVILKPLEIKAPKLPNYWFPAAKSKYHK